MLRYSYPQEVLQEIPGELTLALSISGCKQNRKGCHSSEIWNPHYGTKLTVGHLLELLNKYKNVTCVLFYGGEWDIEELDKMLVYIKAKGLKTALYSGEELDYFDDNFVSHLDYLKVGKYIEELGGLSSKDTNQKLYEIHGTKNYITEINMKKD